MTQGGRTFRVVGQGTYFHGFFFVFPLQIWITWFKFKSKTQRQVGLCWERSDVTEVFADEVESGISA